MTQTRRRLVRRSSDIDPQSLLEGLNPEQREVVEHDTGAALVVAVAGAGKTRALVHRIAYLVAERDVDPTRILAVTFSRKAADEMNERLRSLGIVVDRDRGTRVGTWHSLALQILSEEMDDFDDWEIDDRDRFRGIVKKVLGWQGMNWKMADLTEVLSYIGLCRANLAEPGTDAAFEIAKKLFDERPCGQRDPRLLGEAYENAVSEQIQRRLLTFDDMLVGAWKKLLDDTVRERWSNRWDYLLCDEAQDNNLAQATIAEQLARRHGNYMMVGDSAQSIYKFRGAIPEKLLAFEREWGARVIRMARNYRSGREILTAANGTIRAMDPATHLGVEMVCERDASADVSVGDVADMDVEGEEIVRLMMTFNSDERRRRRSWKDMAVLYRTNAQSRGIEEACLSNRIPYIVLGGTNFYNRREVKDLLSYLRIAAGRGEWDDVKRAINAPFRFLAKAFQDRIKFAAGSDATPNWAAIVRKVADQSGVQQRQRQSALEWAALIDGLAKSVEIQRRDREVAVVPEENRMHHYPAALFERIISEVDYMRYITRDEGAETVENNRVSNVRELVRSAERFTTADELLEYVDRTIAASRKANRERNEDCVTLCSIHKAKGLEWPIVFVAGCNEKILPHGRATDIEEERRLFYVAVTRAMDVLKIFHVQRAAFGERLLPLEPSRFLAEAGLVAGAAS